MNRLSVLLLGRGGTMLDKTAEFLRSNNYEVVIATAPEELAGLLPAAGSRFAGVLLLAEPKDQAPGAFLAEVRRLRRYAKIVLKPAGCSPDELDGELLKGADLVLGPDLPEASILSRLELLLK